VGRTDENAEKIRVVGIPAKFRNRHLLNTIWSHFHFRQVTRLCLYFEWLTGYGGWWKKL